MDIQILENPGYKFMLVPDFGTLNETKFFYTYEDAIKNWIMTVCENCKRNLMRKDPVIFFDFLRLVDLTTKKVYRLYNLLDYVKKNSQNLELGFYLLSKEVYEKKIPIGLYDCIREINVI